MLADGLKAWRAVGVGLALWAGAASFAPVASAQSAQRAIDRPGFSGEDFSALAKRLMPSVVNISTRQTVARGDGLPSFPPGSPLNEFNDFFGRGDQGGMRRQSALGSGFIIDSLGHVVTNNHVIEEADEIDVILSDGTVLSAKLVGRDEETDLALLKVDSKGVLTPAVFGNSDTAQVGEWVVAIGNPFGLGGTVTAGIISARNRDISAGSFDDFIQTDAAINRGNSGGPLFNLKGEVIGINTAIFSPGDSGGSVGVGFSVPSNLTKSVVAQLKRYGSTRRGSLGVMVRAVDQQIAEAYGLKRPEGAIITGVTKGGPAEGAGLKVGDLITAFNNQPIRESRDLSRIIGVAQVGAQISVRYIRGGKPAATTVRLAAQPSLTAPTETAEREAARELSNILGVTFGVIEDADRRRNGIPASVRGVIVRQIETGSDALGKLRLGSVVTEVNFQPVSNPEQAIAAAESADQAGKPVLLQVWGVNEASFVSVKTR
ncbi:MAG: Do family serine endopeptidase [Alphaproteobacteria bacterium]|nr:Do family serine endopeptidase [Alphaproteobacteria bacterium]